MVTRDRQSKYPDQSQQVLYQRTDTGQWSTYLYYATAPGFQASYEKYTPNSQGYSSKQEWKPFQHYLRVVDAPTMPKRRVRSSYFSADAKKYPSLSTPLDYVFSYKLKTTGGYLLPFGDYGRWNLNPTVPDLTMPEDAYGNFIPVSSDLLVMRDRMFMSLMPIIKDELSLVNSLIELKDFRSTARTAVSALKSRSFVDMLRKVGFFKRKKMTLADAARSVANSHLFYKFALAPLVSDIAAVHAAMTRTATRIEDLLDREGKVQRKHKTVSFQERPLQTSPDVSQEYDYPINGISQTYRDVHHLERTVRDMPTTVHVEVQYNYNYTELQRTHAHLYGHLDALGFNANPAIIWNAIPWTFVIDWVVNVSSWLESLKEDNMTPKINIIRTLWSVKRMRITEVRDYSRYTYPGAAYRQVQLLPRLRETAYRRDVGFATTSLIQSSGLSLDEFSLASSLAIARRRVPRRT